MKILFMGAPASGKGEVSRRLGKTLDLPVISTGEELRNISEESIWYETIHKDMDEGKLVENSIVGSLLKELASSAKYTKGYILDGWARRMSDLEHFDPKPEIAILLKISEETARKRIVGRNRADDSDSILAGRFKIFENDTVPVINMYKDQGLLLSIDGEGTKDEVFALTLKALASSGAL